ncbi:MAG TPA: PAS domain S-box protein, partial [Urbifossiella sp.]|nr:PAS domain S-box protein [Urbifossiella sp.]
YANDAYTRLTGYNAHEVVGQPFRDVAGDEIDPAVRQGILDAFNCERLHQVELWRRHKDGTGYWVDLSLVPIPSQAGGVAHWVAIQRDATERKRTEESLRASEEQLRTSEERLRLIGDNLPAGAIYHIVAHSEFDVRFAYVSAGVERIFGFPPGVMLEDPELVYRLIHPDDLNKVRAAQRDSHRDLTPFDVEFRTHTIAGEMFWVHCRSMPRRLADGRTERYGVILDVTERKRAEEALRRSEEMFRGIFESTAAGISLADNSGRFLSCNPAFAANLGRSVEQVIGLRIVEVTHPDDWKAQQPLVDELRSGVRERFAITKRYLRPDGETVWGELSVAAIRGPDREFRYGLGVSIDVTARRRLEEQLQEARKLEAVGRLAGGIAHDFNNLLTGMIGHLSLVQLPADDPNRGHLAAIDQAAMRAADLTRKLLGFARRSQIVPMPVSPREAFDGIVKAFRRRAEEGRVHIAAKIAADCGSILADPVLLHQALLDLSLNSFEAMPEGGTLTLTASPLVVVENDATVCPEARPGAYVRLSVADTGSGMTEAVRGQLFEPFFTTKEAGKGKGLGLAMVRGIVKQHGGWVECHSSPMAGTRFDLHFAAAATGGSGSRLMHVGSAVDALTVTPSPTETTVTDALPDPALRTILFVDDDEMIRKIGRTVLDKAGYRVLQAQDGLEAVNVFARERGRIDLIVMDMTMPRLSGRDAFRQIARIAPNARVLFSSGFSPEDIADIEGSVGLLSKPYRPPELVAAVRDALALMAVVG